MLTTGGDTIIQMNIYIDLDTLFYCTSTSGNLDTGRGSRYRYTKCLKVRSFSSYRRMFTIVVSTNCTPKYLSNNLSFV